MSFFQRELRSSTSQSNLSQVATSTWLANLGTETGAWISVLVAEEAAKTLHRSDMDKLLELMQVIPEGLATTELPGLGQDRVGTVMRSFYSSLFSTVAPQFERLQDPEMREITRRRTAEAVADAHARVYAMVAKPENAYDKSILSHTAEEVRVLLGCS